MSPRGAQGIIAHVAAVTAPPEPQRPGRVPPENRVVPVSPVGPGPRTCLPEGEGTLGTPHTQAVARFTLCALC